MLLELLTDLLETSRTLADRLDRDDVATAQELLARRESIIGKLSAADRDQIKQDERARDLIGQILSLEERITARASSMSIERRERMDSIRRMRTAAQSYAAPRRPGTFLSDGLTG